jgi:LytS/YehU family sensor histidine kinase
MIFCNVVGLAWIHHHLVGGSPPCLLLFQDAAADLTRLLQKENDQVQRAILLALIPVVVAFSFIVFVFYRSKRESHFKRMEADFKLSIAEGELKTLRAQMNPHFIFNCMNSIHHFMHSNQAGAGEYLVKFSQLIRHVLESSSLPMVPLTDEIEALRNYIELEQLRLNHSFDFAFRFDPGFNADTVQIPPMIIQPFIENSIWHGLNQLGSGGRIDIGFSIRDERHLLCEVEDNGKESQEKSELDLSRVVKKTSMGMALIQDRLQIINTLNNTRASFEIVPHPEGANGKKIRIIIPFYDL